MKKNPIYLNRTLFYSPCYIGLCLSEEEFQRELKKLKVKEDTSFLGKYASATTHFLEKGDELIVLVCLGKTRGKSKAAIHALLVHEAVHIWTFIKSIIGEKTPSEEFEAYAMQNICQNLFKRVDE